MTDPVSRFNQFREAVVAKIGEALPALGECKEQFGRFNLEELETVSIKPPAVRVAILKSKVAAMAAGQQSAQLECAAFVIVDGKDRDPRGWVISEAIAALLHTGQLWGLTQLSVPAGVTVMPVLTAQMKQRAVSLFAVEWSQELRQIGAALFDEGHVLEELYVNDEEIDLDALAGEGAP